MTTENSIFYIVVSPYLLVYLEMRLEEPTEAITELAKVVTNI